MTGRRPRDANARGASGAGWLLAAMVLVGAAACSSPRVDRAPADVTFSIGIVDGNPGTPVAGGSPANGGAPQSATTVHLRFNGGTRGPFTVVAERLAAPAAAGVPPDWSAIPSSTVPLTPASDAVGMSREAWNTEFQAAKGYLQISDYGIYYVKVKAAYDDRRLYLHLEWPDSTASVARGDWVYQLNPSTGAGAFVRRTTDEDVVYVSFLIDPTRAAGNAGGCAAACHVNERLGATGPDDVAWRFTMHSPTADLRADTWTWRAGRTNPLGLADDGGWDDVASYDDCPDPPACTAACVDGAAPPCSVAPWAPNADASGHPLYMAPDGAAASPAVLFLAGAGTPEAVAFDPLAAATGGATLPGYALRRPSRHRDDVSATGTWADGVWTLTLSRDLVTDDPNDAQFPLP